MRKRARSSRTIYSWPIPTSADRSVAWRLCALSVSVYPYWSPARLLRGLRAPLTTLQRAALSRLMGVCDRRENRF